MQQQPRVVIVGGGFGGLAAARALSRAPVFVTVIDRSNSHLFQPLLYQVATAGLSPADIARPIRNILRRQLNADVLLAEVTGVDLDRRRVNLAGGDSRPYDYLVLATGAVDCYFGHDDWAFAAPGLKGIPGATHIRSRILRAFEKAEAESDQGRRNRLLTFVIVGGGPTGVEMAGAIAELARLALPADFRHIDTRSARIILVEAGPRLLAAFSEPLSAAARRRLERMGVEIRCGSRVETIDGVGVFAAGEEIPAETVIWAAGVTATPVCQWLRCECGSGGRVPVLPDLSIEGRPEVFVVGDAALVKRGHDYVPGLAPAAQQEGRYAASVIAARAAGRPDPKPWVYLDKGMMATVGRKFAVAQVGPLKLTGVAAWLAWMAIHVYYLIGFRSRLLVMLEWAWAYFTFQRGARLITVPADDANS
ncbi:MAG: NAD(P)/FAD-dependent oxidoreductase [Armatimonadetes bacterium]|nr:NAD(P)/FAD-dependent oxidoreductase [Armatimonadota bacterium]MDE2205113.1 NAD(P)/FAD-dependent oxidoreductase [Armatimonadota bacterium]